MAAAKRRAASSRVTPLADKAFGTDRVPPEIKEFYPDYQAIDVADEGNRRSTE